MATAQTGVEDLRVDSTRPQHHPLTAGTEHGRRVSHHDAAHATCHRLLVQVGGQTGTDA